MQPAKSIGIVIPIVHPEGKKVKNYSRIEFVLYQTLKSLTGLNCADLKICVLCHQTPKWANEFISFVDFLDVGERDCFRPNSNTVQIDKGLKYLVGITHLLQQYELDYVVPMDGDDFLRADLLDHLKSELDADTDGFIIESGFHVCLHFESERKLRVMGAFKVREFNESCGSCRVFYREAIRRHVSEAFEPKWIENKLVHEKSGQGPGSSISNLYAITDSAVAELTEWSDENSNLFDTLIHALGRHVKQERQFTFTKISEALAAKGCGHDNHDGPRRGEVHWFLLTGWWTVGRWSREFSVKKQPLVELRTDWLLVAKAYIWRRQKRNFAAPPETAT